MGASALPILGDFQGFKKKKNRNQSESGRLSDYGRARRSKAIKLLCQFNCQSYHAFCTSAALGKVLRSSIIKASNGCLKRFPKWAYCLK